MSQRRRAPPHDGVLTQPGPDPTCTAFIQRLFSARLRIELLVTGQPGHGYDPLLPTAEQRVANALEAGALIQGAVRRARLKGLLPEPPPRQCSRPGCAEMIPPRREHEQWHVYQGRRYCGTACRDLAWPDEQRRRKRAAAEVAS